MRPAGAEPQRPLRGSKEQGTKRQRGSSSRRRHTSQVLLLVNAANHTVHGTGTCNSTKIYLWIFGGGVLDTPREAEGVSLLCILHAPMKVSQVTTHHLVAPGVICIASSPSIQQLLAIRVVRSVNHERRQRCFRVQFEGRKRCLLGLVKKQRTRHSTSR